MRLKGKFQLFFWILKTCIKFEVFYKENYFFLTISKLQSLLECGWAVHAFKDKNEKKKLKKSLPSHNLNKRWNQTVHNNNWNKNNNNSKQTNKKNKIQFCCFVAGKSLGYIYNFAYYQRDNNDAADNDDLWNDLDFNLKSF